MRTARDTFFMSGILNYEVREYGRDDLKDDEIGMNARSFEEAAEQWAEMEDQRTHEERRKDPVEYILLVTHMSSKTTKKLVVRCRHWSRYMAHVEDH